MTEKSTPQNSGQTGGIKLKWVLLCLIVIGVSYVYQLEPQSTPVNYNAKHVLVTKGGDLLDSTGRLTEVGYALRPLKELNEENIRPFLGIKALNQLRYKKWDFFDATHDDAQLLIHFADLGYVANVQLLVFFHKNNQILQDSDVIYNLSRMPNLPRTSNRFEGQYKYSSENINIEVKYTPSSTSGSNKHLVNVKFNTNHFSGNVTYTKYVDHDEIVMLTPLTEDHRNFYYNTKTYCMEVEGRVDFKNETIKPLIFTPSTTGGGRDIGRGVWNYFTYWFWAFGQGFITDHDGQRKSFGIDLGNGFEMANSTTYEDSIFVAGKMHKLGVVKRTIDEQNLSIPWTLVTDSQTTPGSLNAKFHPMETNYKRENKILVDVKFRQFFGYFSGHFIDNKGHKIQFDKVYGFCEVHKAKW